MGTCEQRDTGQGHPDKGTGQRTDDYLQTHGHFCWNGRHFGRFGSENVKNYMKKSSLFRALEWSYFLSYMSNNIENEGGVGFFVIFQGTYFFTFILY